MSNPNLEEIVKRYLKEHGFTALAGDECGCTIEDLMPCGDPHWTECVAAYQRECTKVHPNCECGAKEPTGELCPISMTRGEISFFESMLGDISHGTKTCTRRVCRHATEFGLSYPVPISPGVFGDEEGALMVRCPYGKPGDHLRVKCNIEGHAATRMLLEIVSIRLERLQDMTEADAEAEGCFALGDCEFTAVRQFKETIWDKIYPSGPNSWAANPWVWVIEFKVVKP